MKERRNKGEILAVILLTAMIVGAFLVVPGWRQRRPSGYSAFIPVPAGVKAAEISPWEQAVRQVKEDRGEPMGKQAKIEIPAQLKHYSDTRRFLAVQVAEWREHRFETPQDFTDLAELIRRGELVEVKTVGENHILYGVGGSADKEQFTHYDKSTGKRITLYDETELSEEYAKLDEALTSLKSESEALRKELAAVPKRERSRRAELQTQLTRTEKSLKSERERKEMLEGFYGDAERRRELFTDYENLSSLSKDFSGRTYKLGEAASRREMKVRMLSHLRPEARVVLEEIARSYKQKFDRPLPITSLVRPDEYQHMLSRENPNATLIATPPHSTGLAFDIYYRFMTAEEQSYVMGELARLKDEGRIEVLRENRDHYHVFAFIDGGRPSEGLIRESLNKTSSAKRTEETPSKEKEKEKASDKSDGEEKRAAKKETAKKVVKSEATKKESKSKKRR
ncbi:MAG TPA: DUF5715 family protein [Pyrinomonadaceae bacterium]